jgi:AcrR family transcriptional regulator
VALAQPPRRRHAAGERSRQTILEAAAQLATVEGLDGLSIGRLASEVGMSKSGLYAHFRSKLELQLATIATAGDVFQHEVIEPGQAAEPGTARVLALSTRSSPMSSGVSFPAAASSPRQPPR